MNGVESTHSDIGGYFDQKLATKAFQAKMPMDRDNHVGRWGEISVRSARRIEQDTVLPSQKSRRYWRSCPDSFAEVWDSEVVPVLANAPQLQAVTILRKLQDDHPGEYPDSTRRTLERRVRHWRARSGPSKEVFFPQLHEPGARSLSDFTDMAELRVTIAGVPFEHRLYHFVLAFSRWE